MGIPDTISIFNPQSELKTGNKRYELTNHLGNILAVISDRKIPKFNNVNSTFADYYAPVVLSASDYYPFGMEMPGRTMGGYRYGFNRQEKNAEFGGMTHLSFMYRIYNPSVGRFLSVDPIAPLYPYYTPYQFAGNTPIWARELEGLEPDYSNKNAHKDGSIAGEYELEEVTVTGKDPNSERAAKKRGQRIKKFFRYASYRAQTGDRRLANYLLHEGFGKDLGIQYMQNEVHRYQAETAKVMALTGGSVLAPVVGAEFGSVSFFTSYIKGSVQTLAYESIASYLIHRDLDHVDVADVAASGFGFWWGAFGGSFADFDKAGGFKYWGGRKESKAVLIDLGVSTTGYFVNKGLGRFSAKASRGMAEHAGYWGQVAAWSKPSSKFVSYGNWGENIPLGNARMYRNALRNKSIWNTGSTLLGNTGFIGKSISKTGGLLTPTVQKKINN